MEVVYISMVKPYKKVANAGGQTFYFYIERLSQKKDINITLIAKTLDNENDEMDIDNINYIPIRNKKISLFHPIVSISDMISKINPYNKRGTTLRKSVYTQIEEVLKKIKVVPDVIVLEFTQMVLMVDIVKKYFPTSKIIASEHDVSFLRCKREMDNESNIVKKIYKKIVYKTIKKNEILALKQCDLVMPHNNKDKELLLKSGIKESNIFTLVPYYKKNILERKHLTNDIIFYGAMGRRENYESAIWFIEKVMPLIKEASVRFIVVGANPVEQLKQLESDKVIVTGYVEEVTSYFEKCLCMVAPLISGAGIKIKVLEAMASGVPVITNKIGIEGIPARDGYEYIHCETAKQYAEAINKIVNSHIDVEQISESAKGIVDKFNMDKSFEEYYKNINKFADR